jgi:hypothetical protein
MIRSLAFLLALGLGSAGPLADVKANMKYSLAADPSGEFFKKPGIPERD